MHTHRIWAGCGVSRSHDLAGASCDLCSPSYHVTCCTSCDLCGESCDLHVYIMKVVIGLLLFI